MNSPYYFYRTWVEGSYIKCNNASLKFGFATVIHIEGDLGVE